MRCDLRSYGFHRSNEVVFANPRRCRFAAQSDKDSSLARFLELIGMASTSLVSCHTRAKGVVERAQINASVRPQKQAVVLAVRVAIPHQRVENELLCPLPHQQATVRLPFQQGKRIGSSHGILRMPRNAQRLREILNMDAPNLPVGANLAIEPFDDISLIFAERPHKRPRNVQPARCRKVHGRIFHQRGAAKALMGRLHDVGRRMLGVRPGPAVVEPLQGEFALRTRKGETTAAIIGLPRRPTSPEPVNLDRDVPRRLRIRPEPRM